jgi:hypothetical protein
MKSNSLTPSESRKYAALKEAMRQGAMAWAEALYEIREGRLWQDEYKSFEQFIEHECDYSRARIYQLLKAVEGQRKLSNKVDCPPPINTKIAVEIASIPEEHVAAVIEAATEGGTKPATAAAVKRVAGEIVTPYVTPDATPDVTPKPDDTPAAKFRKLRSVAKQHNAAMIRAIDSMNDLILNPGTHRKLVQHYEAIDKLLEGWPV